MDPLPALYCGKALDWETNQSRGDWRSSGCRLKSDYPEDSRCSEG